jgi:hypothetical protein
VGVDNNLLSAVVDRTTRQHLPVDQTGTGMAEEKRGVRRPQHPGLFVDLTTVILGEVMGADGDAAVVVPRKSIQTPAPSGARSPLSELD